MGNAVCVELGSDRGLRKVLSDVSRKINDSSQQGDEGHLVGLRLISGLDCRVSILRMARKCKCKVGCGYVSVRLSVAPSQLRHHGTQL